VVVSRTSFQKQQREKARRERAAAKRAKRAERANTDASSSEPEGPPRDEAAVLADLAELHVQFDAGRVSFEQFEASKQQLVEQLDVR
jgi:hypothetical protein